MKAHRAPRLANMSDWYLVRQLRNFQQDIRGYHPHDLPGWQMAEMARILVGEDAVNDVVAHIVSLPRPAQTVARAGTPRPEED